MLNKRKLKTIVKNITDGQDKFVVARPTHSELWYWGRFPTYEKAFDVALEIDGIVLEEDDED